MTEISIIGGGRGNPNVAYPMATVTDTPITLTNQSPRNIMLTGSASGVNVVLPDATTLTVGDTWTIKNASSEFVVVKNDGTASSVFELVGPGCTLTAVCTNVGSAAGTWDVTQSGKAQDIRYRGFVTDMHLLGFDYGTPANGGATSRSGHGVQSLITGTNSAGAYRSHVTHSTFTAQTASVTGAIIIDNIAFPYQLSNATDEFIMRIGVFSTGDFSYTKGLYFKYDRAVRGATWFAVHLDGGTETTATDTGVTVDTLRNRMTIVINAALTRADFYIKKTKVATITGAPLWNFAAANMVVAVEIAKTAGTTSVIAGVDRLEGWQRVPSRGN